MSCGPLRNGLTVFCEVPQSFLTSLVGSIEQKEKHSISTVCAMADGCLLLQVRRVTLLYGRKWK